MSVFNLLFARHRPRMSAALDMPAYGWRRDLKDVGDQALIRGLDAAFPCMRPGADPILQRASAGAGHKASDGYSPAVVPPPPVRGICDVVRLVAPPWRQPT
jgi:hypothetical protein